MFNCSHKPLTIFECLTTEHILKVIGILSLAMNERMAAIQKWLQTKMVRVENLSAKLRKKYGYDRKLAMNKRMATVESKYR